MLRNRIYLIVIFSSIAIILCSCNNTKKDPDPQKKEYFGEPKKSDTLDV